MFEARGRYNHEDAERELIRLARSGLDKDDLLSSYESEGQHGVLFGRLDPKFQKRTLRQYFPQEADAWIASELPWLQQGEAA